MSRRPEGRRNLTLEVSVINKQKFLAELAKLLTFMYDEDRQRALGVYNDMFDEAEDEQALLQVLVSPLRQAVEVARAYNAGKPAMSAGAKPDEDHDNGSAFLEAIYRIRAEALGGQHKKTVVVDEDQISLFDADEEPEEAPASEEAPAEDAGEAGPEEAEEPAGNEAEEPEAEAEEEAEEDETETEEADEEEAPAPKAPAPKAAAAERLPVQKTVRKPRVLLMILYILLAIPLTLLGIVILLIPAIASLAAAAACIAVAVLTVTSAFGSFPKIANLLVAVGAALILLALGLVFLMLFIWFLGGAIGGLVQGVIALGGKICYKEVAAE